MHVAVVQMNSQADKRANLEAAKALINEAAQGAPDLIVLPENFACLTDDVEAMRASAETFPDGEAYGALAALARRHRTTIHAGSMVERSGNQCFNTSVVFDPEGREIARYRKIHLFDVEIPGGTVYRESDSVARGDRIVTYRVGDAVVGCTICYDLRFPELFRALRDAGATVIVLPAAFTLATGKDHWELLLRARAIETQCYVVASAQVFSHAEGRKVCFGRSMVIDPWGLVAAQVPDAVGHAAAALDFDRLDAIRAKLPVARHHVLPL